MVAGNGKARTSLRVFNADIVVAGCFTEILKRAEDPVMIHQLLQEDNLIPAKLREILVGALNGRDLKRECD